jgi:hypothetical protein
MYKPKMCAATLLALPLSFLAVALDHAMAQQPATPPNPTKARTTYSFPIRRGVTPFRFQVELDQARTVTGVSVFKAGEAKPFQTLPACPSIVTAAINDNDAEELLTHADLNFDGFEDVELLQFRHPQLGTKLYCIYTWENNSGRFRYAPEIPAVSPVAHPENKTITVHQEWQGGIYADSTYKWAAAALQLIEERGRISGSDDPKCTFADHCDKVVSGKMITTLYRPVACSDGRPDPPLVCPAGATRPATNAPKQQSAAPAKP